MITHETRRRVLVATSEYRDEHLAVIPVGDLRALILCADEVEEIEGVEDELLSKIEDLEAKVETLQDALTEAMS